MIIIDYVGHYGPVIIFAMTFYTLLKRVPYLIGFTGGSILNTFMNEVLKNIFREPRPLNQIPFIDDKDLHGVHYYGFPSGHAQASAFALAFMFLTNGPPVILYAMCAIFIITLYQRWKYNRHSIKQLVAGAIVGGAFAWVVHYMVQYYIHQYKIRWSCI